MIFSDSPSQKALERMMTQIKGFPPTRQRRDGFAPF